MSSAMFLFLRKFVIRNRFLSAASDSIPNIPLAHGTCCHKQVRFLFKVPDRHRLSSPSAASNTYIVGHSQTIQNAYQVFLAKSNTKQQQSTQSNEEQHKATKSKAKQRETMQSNQKLCTAMKGSTKQRKATKSNEKQ